MDASTPNPASSTQIYTVAITLTLLSLLLILLILPPLIWHARNRNLGATSLVAWTILLLAFTALNALLWPSDDTVAWFSGIGLCDVQVRLQVASQVAVPASFAAVLRGLAKVLDTENATLGMTKAQRRRNVLLDSLFCVGAPVLQIAFFEIVHGARYAIFGIAGCAPAVSDSWVMVLLLIVPPLLWTLLDAFYATQILTRLYRYRATLTNFLTHSRTTKSRFLRLYLLCSTWLLASLPLIIYILVSNLRLGAGGPYSWTDTHNHAAYNLVFLVPSGGTVVYDRWIWIGTGAAVFAFFGWGREAVGMYRAALLAVGVGRIFPGLKREPSRRGTIGTISSVSSRARLFFSRKSMGSSQATSSTWASKISTLRNDSQSDEPLSPKTGTFPNHTAKQISTSISTVPDTADLEKGVFPSLTPPSLWARMTAFFRPTNTTATEKQRGSAPVPLAELTNTDSGTVKATVTAGPRSPRSVGDGGSEVLVRKEVRQGSTHG